MSWTLAATAAGSAVAAAVYGGLAWSLWRRPGEADARLATRAFAFFWGTTGAFQAMSAVQHGLAAAGWTPFALAVVVRYAGIALASVGVGGLVYYFAFLRTGRTALLRPIAATYLVVLVLTWAHVAWSRPVGVALTAWSVDVAYAGDFQGGLFAPLVVMLLVVPVLGAAWYLTLLPKLADPRQRLRVLAVGCGVGLQLLAFLVARVVESAEWQLVSRVVMGIVVAALVLAAYGPAGLSRSSPASAPSLR